jgi:hypothetical protein
MIAGFAQWVRGTTIRIPRRRFRKGMAMHSEWLAFEHYRMHVIELWPGGPRKEAELAAARSAIESLTGTMSEESSFSCAICSTRRQTVTVIPLAPRVHGIPLGLAA